MCKIEAGHSRHFLIPRLKPPLPVLASRPISTLESVILVRSRSGYEKSVALGLMRLLTRS